MAGRSRMLGMLIAGVLVLVSGTSAIAHTPAAGSQDQYSQSPRITLFWGFKTHSSPPHVAWPSYAKTAVRDALDTGGWSDTGFNASQTPDYECYWSRRHSGGRPASCRHVLASPGGSVATTRM